MGRRRKKNTRPCKRNGAGGAGDRVRRQPIRESGCRKMAYRTKADAKLALKNVRGVRRMQARLGVGPAAHGKAEQAPYRCARCGMWHLTSLPRGVSVAIGRRVRGVRE